MGVLLRVPTKPDPHACLRSIPSGVLGGVPISLHVPNLYFLFLT